MIIFSLLLIVLAMVLLGVGLLGGENSYLIASIAASVLASISLAVRGRMGRTRAAVVVPSQRASDSGIPTAATPASDSLAGVTGPRGNNEACEP